MFFTKKEKWCEITIFIDGAACFDSKQKPFFLDGEHWAKLFWNYSVEWEIVFWKRNILIYAVFRENVCTKTTSNDS